MKNTLRLPISLAVLLVGSLPGWCEAQQPDTRGYVVDSVVGFVGSGTAGQCWHNGEWSPALSVAPCDPVAVNAASVSVPAAPVAEVAPAPTPIAVALVAAPMPPQHLNFAADTLFGFDKSVLSPRGMRMLDDLAATLNGATFDSVHVSGYTDRIGSKAYNQKLSLRRAKTVREYLVQQGVAAGSIQARGEGESHPVTTMLDCPAGLRHKLIDCLQADRRVEVEVQGTRIAN